MNEREMMDYTTWIWNDLLKQLALAAVIYTVALGAYWLLVA